MFQVEEKNTFPRRSTRRKPKLPTPPCSPNIGGRTDTCSTPSPPPPPLPETDQIMCSEPLPPPPSLAGSQKPGRPAALPFPVAGRQPATATSQILPAAGRQVAPPPHHIVSTGRQPAAIPAQVSIAGRQPATTPTRVQTAGRQPANTPKRDSPATIAAKEAPGKQIKSYQFYKYNLYLYIFF